ncbi:MAG: hypothetical protein AB8G26_16365 [Ilumatobacter sp.]
MTISYADNSAPTTARPPAIKIDGRISPFRSDADPTPDFEDRWSDRLEPHARGQDFDHARRTAVTTLVGALRGGTTINRVLTVTAGLTAQDLAVAYGYVDRKRAASVAAFDELVADPTAERFDAVEERLDGLFSQVASVLRPFATGDPGVFAAAVADIGEEAARLDDRVDNVHAELRTGMMDTDRLLTLLDDGHQSGLHHHACYRPRRVGDIVPARLADLLGETDPRERT